MNKIISYFKSLFINNKIEEDKFESVYDINDEEIEEDSPSILCSGCSVKKLTGGCKECIAKDIIEFVTPYNKSLKTLVIVDDNKGAASFLADDIIDDPEISDVNIIIFTGQYAGFVLEEFINISKLHIDYAILDITLGGLRRKNGINVLYDGVDIYKILMDLDSSFKYIFYTSNNMNKQLKTINNIYKKYRKYSGMDIKDMILYKASVMSKDDYNFIKNKLFN